jgi:hypothetical protein
MSRLVNCLAITALLTMGGYSVAAGKATCQCEARVICPCGDLADNCQCGAFGGCLCHVKVGCICDTQKGGTCRCDNTRIAKAKADPAPVCQCSGGCACGAGCDCAYNAWAGIPACNPKCDCDQAEHTVQLKEPPQNMLEDHERRIRALEAKMINLPQPAQALRGLTVEELRRIDPWYRQPALVPGGTAQIISTAAPVATYTTSGVTWSGGPTWVQSTGDSGCYVDSNGNTVCPNSTRGTTRRGLFGRWR